MPSMTEHSEAPVTSRRTAETVARSNSKTKQTKAGQSFVMKGKDNGQNSDIKKYCRWESAHFISGLLPLTTSSKDSCPLPLEKKII